MSIVGLLHRERPSKSSSFFCSKEKQLQHVMYCLVLKVKTNYSTCVASVVTICHLCAKESLLIRNEAYFCCEAPSATSFRSNDKCILDCTQITVHHLHADFT